MQARCPLCGAPQETVAHFVLHCPRLAHARRGHAGGSLAATISAACTHPAMLALLAQPQDHDDTLLALTLGGDLSDHPGLGLFMKPRSAANKHPGHPHPARDRLAALHVTGDILVALDRARGALLTALGGGGE